MKLSKLLVPILKENPKEAGLISHSLLQKAGYIRQTASGIYTFLPLGKMVLNRLISIINQEMQSSGAQELLMPTLQVSEVWKESGRYQDYGLEMLKVTDRHGRELIYGPTNEEQITQIFRDNVNSYKSLPLVLYQIQWKFRDEIRPRFGLMRGREFLMKDAYSFDLTAEAATQTYCKMFTLYLKIFGRMGIFALPMQADTGPIGGDLSHEFIILTSAGESNVYVDQTILDLEHAHKSLSYDDAEGTFNRFTNIYAVTEEKFSPSDSSYLQVKDNVVQTRGIEVGQLFYFGTKYSSPMNASVLMPEGHTAPVFMGSYGIGVSRLLAAIVEAHHDEKGIIWPEPVAPFQVIINALGTSEEILQKSGALYQECKSLGLEILLNDVKASAGSKLNTADLIGIPWQVNIWPRGLKKGLVEIKCRRTGEVTSCKLSALPDMLSTKVTFGQPFN